MKLYLISLSIGILVGVIYALLEVRSPAPPVIALIGLLGILIGEQVVPIAKRLIEREPISVSWLSSECGPHILGELPQRQKRPTPEVPPSKRDRT
jgi:XapX domain-containing protein